MNSLEQIQYCSEVELYGMTIAGLEQGTSTAIKRDRVSVRTIIDSLHHCADQLCSYQHAAQLRSRARWVAIRYNIPFQEADLDFCL